jgi:hypothetical protein
LKLKESDFEPRFAVSLPETYTLILSANLTIHPDVSRVILHGSRGPAGGSRPDSDIDLSLIVDPPQGTDMERQLQEVLQTTLNHWQANVEPDLAVVFDVRKCGLKCFDQSSWNEQTCRLGGVDCFGLYKVQKGFSGLVRDAGIQVRLMYPCLKIWQRR